MPVSNPNTTRPGPMRLALIGLTALIVCPALAFSLLHLVLPDIWLADTFVHFRIQYLLVGLVGLILTIWHRKSLLALTSAAVIAMNLIPVMTYFAVPAIGQAHAAQSSTVATQTTEIFRIAAANIYSRNDSFDAVTQWITREDPDFVVLLETSPAWRDELRQRLTQYPHQKRVAKKRRFGKLMLSKLPFDEIEELASVGGRNETPVVTVQRNGVKLRIAGLHTNWPMTPMGALYRNQELVRIAQVAKRNAPPLVALGDYNITPFSKHFQQMQRDGDLRRASAGRGWLHSWPTFFMPAGIQIDHIMITPAIEVADYKTGTGLNSDHKWVMADLIVPATTR